MFQVNAIQSTTAKRMQLGNNGNGSSGQCHGTFPAVVASVQQPTVVSKVTAVEEPTDSGNETSSLSPGHTPVTVSPSHSLPPRSNSFSVSNILRVQHQLRCDQKGESAAAQLAAEKEQTQPKSDQMNEGKMKAQQRVTFQLHPPFGNHSANISPTMGHPLHSAFRAPAAFPFPVPPHPSVGGHPPLGSVFPYHHHAPGVVFAPAAHRSVSLSSATAPLFFTPSPSSAHGISPFFLSNSAAILSLLHQQQQQQQNECCVVCGDRASGHHYGVQSCEGCKGFFRRSIQGATQYECAKNERCVVDKVSRNRCQKCRLAKCFRVGMQPTHVRLEKNRKRKSDSEQRDVGLEATRQAIELISDVVMAFKSSFLTPLTANSGTSSQLIRIPNFCAARHHCRQFVGAIPAFCAFDTDSLLSSAVVSAVVAVLAVLLLKEDNGHPHKMPPLDEGQLGRVRHCFADLELRWEEVAVFIAVMITFDSRSERVEQLYRSLCHGLVIKLSERNSEDGENANPSDIKTETFDLYTKLITNISQIFQRITE